MDKPMDNLSEQQRRRCMKRVKNKNTKPEIVLRKALWQKGFRYRLKVKLIGRPDLVFVGRRIVVFVDGCFWHGCPRCKNIPKTNREFWQAKIDKNMVRDVEVTETPRADNWRVLRFWEHEIKRDFERVIAEITAQLKV
ncbi:very short patch repair endonuclease [Acanthopleuribacter pedis]|uniref:Very short patch repair endonuclease n=1 Tax=Acanthopleuribacter pedis TaxID=442870 RepID=A0A8J7Q5J3_9BACT|nr:very short patch repair endonuclease [Acanthopleuribacter pedis]MBO1318361.1 very short patch repair endonuclease [Acanthopleuribacter pedis]